MTDTLLLASKKRSWVYWVQNKAETVKCMETTRRRLRVAKLGENSIEEEKATTVCEISETMTRLVEPQAIQVSSKKYLIVEQKNIGV